MGWTSAAQRTSTGRWSRPSSCGARHAVSGRRQSPLRRLQRRPRLRRPRPRSRTTDRPRPSPRGRPWLTPMSSKLLDGARRKFPVKLLVGARSSPTSSRAHQVQALSPSWTWRDHVEADLRRLRRHEQSRHFSGRGQSLERGAVAQDRLRQVRRGAREGMDASIHGGNHGRGELRPLGMDPPQLRARTRHQSLYVDWYIERVRQRAAQMQQVHDYWCWRIAIGMRQSRSFSDMADEVMVDVASFQRPST